MVSDLTIMPGPKDIALRLRRSKYAKDYGLSQFTIRYRRDSGVPTEIHKIMQGMGDWFAYFHCNDNDDLADWMIIDLEGFRLNYETLTWGPCNGTFGSVKPNGDGTWLKVFDVKSFPAGILIAASANVLSELPPIYQMAIRRRQTGQWEPYKGMRPDDAGTTVPPSVKAA